MALPDIYTAPMFLPGAGVRVQSGGSSGVGGQAHRALIIGLMLSTGTATADTPVQVTSAEQGVTLFGVGSPLSATIEAFKRHNPLVECWAVGVAEDAGGTAADGEIAVTGPATGAGTISLYIAGRRVSVSVADGDAANDIAAAIEAAIDAVVALPVTSTATLADVAIDAKAKGAWGNDIDIRHSYYRGEELPPGVGLTITAMASGATDPSLATAIANLDDDMRFDTVVVPFTDATTLAAIEGELAARAGADRNIPGQAFAAFRGTYSATQTLGNGRNSEFLTIYGAKTTPTPSWEIAGAVAGIDSGIRDLNVARTGYIARGVMTPTEGGGGFSRVERNLLLQDGISTFEIEGGYYVLERAVTTRQTTDGAEDRNFLDVGVQRVINNLRLDLGQWSKIRYKGHKLGEDADLEVVSPGVKLATPTSIRGDVIGRYRLHVESAYMGDLPTFAEVLIVEIGGTPGRVNVSGKIKPLTALQHIAFDFTFTV